MKELSLTPAQEAIVKNLSAGEKKAFDALKDIDKLAFISRIEMKAESSEGIEFVTGEMELEEVPLLAPKTESNPLGLEAGDVVRGRLLGYVNMFSEDHKENWEKVIDKDSGKIFYRNGYYKFQRPDGSLVGLRAGSNLWRLGKVATVATDPLEYRENPEIAVRYEGKVSKKIAKEKYGIEMQQGTETHVFTFNFGTATVLAVKGIVNHLNPPYPVAKVDDTRSETEIELGNYQAQIEANTKAKQLQLEASASSAH
jgi:hypothetical protein